MGPIEANEPDKIKQSEGQTAVHKHASWAYARADLVGRVGLARQETNVFSDRHSIFLNIKGAATAGENYIDGRRVPFDMRPEGTLSYVPPGCAWKGWDEGDATAGYLLISVEPDILSVLLDSASEGNDLRPELGFTDLPMQCTMRQIAWDLACHDSPDELVIGERLAAIFRYLFRRSGIGAKLPRGGLTPRVLRKTMERIDSHIDRPISLSELSQDVGLSVAHFCRAFKQSVGMTPYAFFNRRRLERASDLLRTTDMSVTEVALACGYASGSHLSTSFRTETGVAPIAYRAIWTD